MYSLVIRKNACGSPRTRAEHELILERKNADFRRRDRKNPIFRGRTIRQRKEITRLGKKMSTEVFMLNLGFLPKAFTSKEL